MEEKLLARIGRFSIGLLIILISGTMLGTVLWFTYPHIHAIFPTAAKNGIIAYDLSWWDSVCITWIFGCLVRSIATEPEKKK